MPKTDLSKRVSKKKTTRTATRTATRKPSAVKKPIPKILSKRFPYRHMKNLDVNDLKEAIDMRISTLTAYDHNELSMLKFLTNAVPYSVAIEFFNNFGDTALNEFPRFQRREDVRHRAQDTTHLLKQRKAIALKPHVHRNVLPTSKYKLKTTYDLQPTTQKKYESEFDDCIRKYNQAAWVKTTGNIHTVVLNENDPANKGYLSLKEIEQPWFVPNRKWYHHYCKHPRPYRKNSVGYYIKATHTIIVETRKLNSKVMQQKSIRRYPPYNESKKLLTGFFQDAFPSVHAKEFIDDLDHTNVDDLIDHLSELMVYTRKLIKGPQLFHRYVQESRIPSDQLKRFKRESMLPEVFYNPEVSPAMKTRVMKLIESKQTVLKNMMKNILMEDKTMNIRTMPSAMPTHTYPIVPVPNCAKVKNPVLIHHEGKLMCIEGDDLLSGDVDSDVVYDAKALDRAALYRENAVCGYCKQMVSPTTTLSSVHDKKLVRFCNTNCMNKYSFRE